MRIVIKILHSPQIYNNYPYPATPTPQSKRETNITDYVLSQTIMDHIQKRQRQHSVDTAAFRSIINYIKVVNFLP